MTAKAQRRRWSKGKLCAPLPAVGRIWRTLVLTGVAMVAIGATASAASAQVGVYVGYADTLRAVPTHFPTPWAPEVHVYGNNCLNKKHPCDGGVIRLQNNGKSPLKIKSVVVKLSTCTFNSWPHGMVIRAGKQIILGNEGRKGERGCPKKAVGFDTSDIGPHGRYWSGHCTRDHMIPKILVTTATGTKTFYDRGQVLNTGGYDTGECPKGTNESEQWVLIGHKICPSATLSLAPPRQKHHVRTAAAVTATLRNSGGPHCGRPLQGAIIKFRVLSGPNRGKTGSSVTNKKGKAPFVYSGRKIGIDRLQAGAKNAVGTIRSNKVTVIWVKHPVRPGHRAGTFSCKGTGATLLTLTFAVANPLDSPCKARTASVVNISGKKSLKVTAKAVSATTFLNAGRLAKAGDNAGADAKVVKAAIGAIKGHHIAVGVVTSQVRESCVKSGPGLRLVGKAKSRVAGLIIGTKKYGVITTPVKIPLGPLATIWINRTIRIGTTLMQRGVQIDLAGKTIVVLAQSQADFKGRPCANTK